MKRSRLLLCLLMTSASHAAEIMTNNVKFINPPTWVTESKIDKAAGQVQNLLEWDTRRVNAYWHDTQDDFERSHGLGKSVIAYFRAKDQTLHFGPQVNKDNFEQVMGHELAHVILFQKYKGAIPGWLEEGLANYAAKKDKVDYKWLASQPFPDVTKMGHPFRSAESPHYHYMASQALIEMIAAKCGLSDMLQLSVGKKLETYLDTFCNVKDVNAEFKKWVTARKK